METAQLVIQVLISNDHLLLATALNVTAICKTFRGALSSMYWERILQRHFPSFYLRYLDDYNKMPRTDISWKHEYKEAYQSMALRYMDGANLQQSRIVHFGPSLDEDTIDDINNHDEGFHLPSNRKLYCLGACYEGNVFHKSGGAFTVTNLTTVIAQGKEIYSNGGVIFGNKFYIAESLNREGRFDCLLTCYNIEPRMKDVTCETTIHGYPAVVAFGNKIFVLDSYNLICFDHATGKELFRIKSARREKRTQEGEEHIQVPNQSKHQTSSETDLTEEKPTKKLRTAEDDDKEEESLLTGGQLAIEGDFAIWTAQGCLVVVANWKKQEIHGVFDLYPTGREDFLLSRFAVGYGVFYVNSYREDMYSKKSFCIAVDLNFASEESGFTELWKYENKGTFDEDADVGPCVYGDIVFDMFSCNNGGNAWVVALDARSGDVIWRWNFDIGRSQSGGKITPVHLFVIEGTASIAERQELRKSDSEESDDDDDDDDDEEDSDDEGADNGGTKKAETAKVAEVKEEDLIMEPTEKSEDTKFPTLRFAIHNNVVRRLYEGAVIAATGEILYFNEHIYKEDPLPSVVAISKHQKPQYLTMSP